MDRRGARFGLLAGVVLIALVPGCASNQKKRMAMLEDANRRLTDQINRMRGDLSMANQDVDELNRRLLTAQQEADSLRAQLADASTPPQAAPGWTPVPGGAMIAIETSVLFAPGKAVLRQESKRTLDAIVSTIQSEYGDKHVFVVGHTDDQPIRKSGWKDNWELSTERSLAVVRYLQEQGVEARRMVAGGAAMYRPVAENTSDRGRARNRRVEIYAVDSHLLTAER